MGNCSTMPPANNNSSSIDLTKCYSICTHTFSTFQLRPRKNKTFFFLSISHFKHIITSHMNCRLFAFFVIVALHRFNSLLYANRLDRISFWNFYFILFFFFANMQNMLNHIFILCSSEMKMIRDFLFLTSSL